MDQKFNLLTPTLVFKPVPYGGIRSSKDFNEFMDTAITDVYSVIELLNKKIIPILNGLPLAEYEESLNAITDGLTAAVQYVGHGLDVDSLHADYYYRTAPSPERINTVKEVFDLLITDFKALEDTVDGLTNQIADLDDPDVNLEVLEEEIKDLRNSVIEIITVLRNLKFYTDWERIHALTVLADPDYTKAPQQTLINISPAVKFSNSVNQNMYVNFAIPRNIDVSQPIVCNFIYCMDTSAVGNVKIDFESQVLANTNNVLNGASSTTSATLSAPTTAYETSRFIADTFTFTAGNIYDLINIRITRDTAVASNHSGNFYILDLSFYGKRLPVNLVSI